jgi:phosphoglycolate phosphatase
VITTALFDLDGTLVDSVPGVQHAMQTAWQAVQPGHTLPDVRQLMGPPIREMFRRCLVEPSDGLLDELEGRFRVAYDGEGWRRTSVFPGVLEALDALRSCGVRCLGVTNKPGRPTQRILEYCGLAGRFEMFLSPDSRVPAFASKTHMVQALVTEGRINPPESALIGDTIEDARVARACGLRFVAFADGYGWADLEAAGETGVVLEHFDQLPRLLRRVTGLFA